MIDMSADNSLQPVSQMPAPNAPQMLLSGSKRKYAVVEETDNDSYDVSEQVLERMKAAESEIRAMKKVLDEILSFLRANPAQPVADKPGKGCPNESFPTLASSRQQKPLAPTITTVWSRSISEAVKSSGIIDKLIYKPPQPKVYPTRHDTILLIGVDESKRDAWSHKKEDDKKAAQEVLASLGVSKDSVIGTYRFLPAKEATSESKRRPQPLRVFLASQAAADEALRRSHMIKNSTFDRVFIRRDLAKEDKEVDKSARQARDMQNKLFEENNITNLKCVVSNRGKVGRLHIIEKKAPVSNADAASQLSTASTSSSSAQATKTLNKQPPLSTLAATTCESPSASKVTAAMTASNSKTQPTKASISSQKPETIVNNQRDNDRTSRSQTRKSGPSISETQQLTSNNAKGKRGGIAKVTHAKVVEELDLTVSKLAKMKAVLARNGIAFDEVADDEEAMNTDDANPVETDSATDKSSTVQGSANAPTSAASSSATA